MPGQHLLESDLTKQLGCSRGSLRPAMIHLAADGIITLNRFKGARISILSRKCIEDLPDVLEALIRFMAIRAHQHIHEADNRLIIEQTLNALKGSAETGDSSDYLQKRQGFIMRLYAPAQTQNCIGLYRFCGLTCSESSCKSC